MRAKFAALLTVICIIISLGVFSPASAIAAGENTTTYALIVENNALFYRTPTNDDSAQNIWFYLPETYFVEIIRQVDNIFYEARYDGISGYVKFSDINIKDYTPASIYPLDLQLKISAVDSTVKVRSVPSVSGNIVATLEWGDIVTYYNKTAGEELEPSNPYWYYVIVENDGLTVGGYVYSTNVQIISDIIIPNDISAAPAVSPGVEEGQKLNKKYENITKIILALAICIPTVAVIFMMFRPREKRYIPHNHDDD